MKPIFKLCKIGKCGVNIIGLEKDDQQYVETPTDGSYTYDETISMNILIPIDSKGNEGTYMFVIDEHNKPYDSTIVEFPKDGLYKIIHSIIPKKDWKDSYSGTNFNNRYYYHNGYFYDDNDLIISAQDVLSGDNVFESEQLTFSSCLIQECYYKSANTFLEKYCSNPCNNKSSVEFDVIWIGMHVLKYLLDFNRLYEALYILEKLTGCTGVCTNNLKIRSYNGCGC